jgi:hypothetical protein
MSTVAQRADSERLPWLEPFAERRARPVRRRGLFAALGGGAALVAALAAGYWLGERRVLDPQPVSAPEVRGGDTAIVPVTPAPTRPEPPLPAAREPAVPPAPTIAPPVAKAEPAPVAKPRPAARTRPPKIRREAPTRSSYENVRARQESRAEPPAVTVAPAPTARVWPRLPSPGPPGQVIQLGAFSHPDRAYSAYRARLARYPALRSMPRVIVPIAPESADGRMLYVLRLGTLSRNQSKSLCRSLKRRGDHCIVIG